MSTNSEPVSGGGAISDPLTHYIEATERMRIRAEASEARAEAAEAERGIAREEWQRMIAEAMDSEQKRGEAESRLAAADRVIQAAKNLSYDHGETFTALRLALNAFDAQPQPTPSPEEEK